jgi:hypothetical protein
LGGVSVKSAFWRWLALTLLFVPLTHSQTPATPDQTVQRMRAALKEAEDIQASELQGVLDKLAPLLDELSQWQAKGALTAETATVYQDGLLLKIRTQIKLLVPDPDIAASFRALLVLSPNLDDTIFNPREKLLFEKIRSAETGRLALQIDPPGGTVTYMGMELGAAPLNVPLIAGTYHLRAQKPGYFDQEFNVTIRPSEIFTMSRALRRRSVEVPFTVSGTSAAVLLGGKSLGETAKYDAWMASLPEERRKEYESIVRAWDIDPASSTFGLIPEAPVGEPLNLEFRAPCHEPSTITLQIDEQEVDWNHPRALRPELRRIELKKDTGFLDISANAAEAEIYIDGALHGKTPMGSDVCSGAHKIQVVHRAGQYVREVIVRRGQISKVTGELKPALAFLGIYTVAGERGAWVPMAPETDALARKLVLEGTSFGDPQISSEEISALRKRGSLPLESLVPASGKAPANAAGLVRDIGAAAGHANLFLFGVKADTQYTFQLYNTLHPIPETILLPGFDSHSLAFLLAQLNRAEKASARLVVADAGLTLIDTAKGPVIVKASGARTGIRPGGIIKNVDAKSMTTRDIELYVRAKAPGSQITLEVTSSKTATVMVPINLAASGSEYPWNTPDGFRNAVMATLYASAELAADSMPGAYAGLSLARAFMLEGEWQAALELLGKTKLQSINSGVSAGTVLYYQGRCHEELGNASEAEACYRRAKEFPNATLGTPGGPGVPALAELRIQSLKK